MPSFFGRGVPEYPAISSHHRAEVFTELLPECSEVFGYNGEREAQHDGDNDDDDLRQHQRPPLPQLAISSAEARASSANPRNRQIKFNGADDSLGRLALSPCSTR